MQYYTSPLQQYIRKYALANTVVKYTTEELHALWRYDVKPARAARKVIFGYRL